VINMRRALALTVLVAVGASANLTVVRAQPRPEAIHLEKVKDNLFVITGGLGTGSQTGTVAGNTTVFVAASGVVLIDTKFAGLGKAILDQVKTVTGKPVTTVINTHTHGDHTGGNGDFPNVEFVAHENTKANMARMDEFKGANARFLPSKTYKDRMSLLGGKEEIALYHFGPGHTNGDTIIVFPALRTAVVGDLFPRKGAPLIDNANGGNAHAYPLTLRSALNGIRNVDTVITGHATTTFGTGAAAKFVRSAPIVRWADLQEYADFMRDFVSAAEAAKKAGKSIDDATKTLSLPEKYRNYDMQRARADVERVYEEIK
jgi:glyoxylase-like metal-dependent hydrolase (beta-lactamase superfamily II)